MRALAEQNLNQSKAAFEGLLAMARGAARGLERQTCAICEHSIAAAEQTLENAFDFAHSEIPASVASCVSCTPSIIHCRSALV
jgi:hypothetical protein